MPYAFYSVLFLNVGAIVFAIVYGLQVDALFRGNPIWLLEIFFLPITPFACQDIMINDIGVKKYFGFICLKKIPWDKICTIQIITIYNRGIPQKFVYFTTRYYDLSVHVKIKYSDRKYIVMVQYSEKLLEYIKACTDKRIEGE